MTSRRAVVFLCVMVAPVALACSDSNSPTVLDQWASSATASTQFTSTDFSALQATGAPNVTGCSDDPHAWASTESNGQDWLEVSYATAVVPTLIEIHENNGPGSIWKVEVKTTGGQYVTVYSNANLSGLDCPHVTSIPVTGVSMEVSAIRISVDQRLLNNWDEIDAVRLVGTQ